LASAWRASAPLDNAGDFFPDDRSHGGGNEIKVHHSKADAVSADLGIASDHRVLQSGLLAVSLEALLIGGNPAKLERIDGKQVGIPLLERTLVDQTLDALRRAKREMVVALRADLQVLFELGFGHHFPATRTLGPQSFRNIALASHANLERRLLENSHGSFLSARDRDDNHGGGPGFSQDAGAGIGRRARGQDIIDEGNGQPFHGRTAAQGKSALQIVEPFFAVKIRLGERVARPAEAITDRQAQPSSGQLGQHSGLIEFPLALASRMERHRDDHLGSSHP
jgi:hypothetical protein